MKQKGLRRLLVRAFLAIFATYAVVMLVDMQVSLAQRKQEFAELDRQREALRLDNKELARRATVELDEEEIERIARENGYVRENDKAFINNSGK